MFWYLDEVKALENKVVAENKNNLKILFYGSSSIRLWDTAQKDFPMCNVVNQAFGGSTLAACCWYFERLVPQHKPDAIVIYAGDNDLGDGRHPEEVYFLFKNIIDLVYSKVGKIPIAFLSIKPSVARQNLYNSIKYTNRIIKNEIDKNYPDVTWVNIFDAMQINGYARKELYFEDGLHMNEKGYKIWKDKLTEDFVDPLLKRKSMKKQEKKKRA